MSQHDLEILNDSGANVRNDINNALQALGSMMTGLQGAMPATYVNQLVADTTSGHIIKRDNSDVDWDYLMPIDQRVIASAVGTDAYAITLSPAIDCYKNGVIYTFRADVGNTGSASLDICTTSVTTIKKYANGALTTLSTGDIVANQIVRVQYDSTNAAFILLNPSMSVSTGVIQVVNYYTATPTSGTTPFNFDSTIPQITEGDQYLTVSITPTSATNYLKIDVCLYGTLNYGGVYPYGVALFQDATANALCAFPIMGYVNSICPAVFTHYMLANTTSSTTFTVRAGAISGYILYVNQFYYSGWVNFGNTITSSITVTEIGA